MDIQEEQRGKQNGQLQPRGMSISRMRRSMRDLLKGGKKKKEDKIQAEKQIAESRELAQQSHRDSIDLSTLPTQGQNLSRSLEILDRQTSLQIKQSRQSNERLIEEYRNNSNVVQTQSIQGQVTHVNNEAQYVRNGAEMKDVAQDNRNLTVNPQSPNGTEVSVISTFQIHMGEGSQPKPLDSSRFRHDRLDSGVEILSSDTEKSPTGLYASDPPAGRPLRSRWTNDWVVQTSSMNQQVQEPASHLVLQPIRIELQSRPIDGEQANQSVPIASTGVRSGLIQSEDAANAMALWLEQEDWRRYCGKVRPQQRISRTTRTELRISSRSGQRETDPRGPFGIVRRTKSADALLSGAAGLRQTRSDDESGIGRSVSLGNHLEQSVRSQRTNDWIGQQGGQHEGKELLYHGVLPPVIIQQQLQPVNQEPMSHRSAPDSRKRSRSEPNSRHDDTYDRFETFVQSLDRLETDSEDAPITMSYWLKNCAWGRYSHIEGFWRYPRYAGDYPWEGTKGRQSDRRSKSSGPMTSRESRDRRSTSEDERGKGYRKVTPRPRYASSDAESSREKRQEQVKSQFGDVWEIPTKNNRSEETENGQLGSRTQLERSSRRSRKDRSERSNREDKTRTRRQNNRRTHGRNQQRGNGNGATSDSRSRSQDRGIENGTREENVEWDEIRGTSRTRLKQRTSSTGSRGQQIEGTVEGDVNASGTREQRASLASNTGRRSDRNVSIDSSRSHQNKQASLKTNRGQRLEEEVFKDNPKTTGIPMTTEGTKANSKGSLSGALFGALLADSQEGDDNKTHSNLDTSQLGSKDAAQDKAIKSPGLTGIFTRSFFGSKSEYKDKDGGLDTQNNKADGEQTGKDDTKAKEESGFGSVFKRPFFTSKAADQKDDGPTMQTIKAGVKYYDDPDEMEESGSFSFMNMIRRRSLSASSCSSDDSRRPGGRKKADEGPESTGMFGSTMKSFRGLFGGDGKSVAQKESEHTIMATGKGKLAKIEAEQNIRATQGSALSRKEAEHGILASRGGSLAKKEAEHGLMASQLKTISEKEAEHSMMASMGQNQSESTGVFGGLFGGIFGGGDGKSQAEKEAEHSIMASQGHADAEPGFLSGLFSWNSAPADRKNKGRRESILGSLGFDDSSCSSSSSDDEDGIMTSLFSAVGLGGGSDTTRRKHGHAHAKQRGRQGSDAMKSAWAKRDRAGGAKKGGESSIFGFLGFGGESDARQSKHSHRHKGRPPNAAASPQLPSIFSAFQPK
ncbi:uncharacterized protein LOC144872601 isoform X2 [Branchiostoma floridae x Branchiostoma japonicum]